MAEHGYITLQTLISEIKAMAFIKDNPQLIDTAGIAARVYAELKTFGNTPMEMKEEVVHVQNYRGQLPSDFQSLGLAVYCKLENVCAPEGCDRALVRKRVTYEKTTCETEQVCTTCEDTCKADTDELAVTESFYVNDIGDVTLKYTSVQYVTLSSNILGNHCATDCVNRHVKASPYSINIKGRTVMSNFDSGSLYIRYNAFVTDEDGFPMIPDTGYTRKYFHAFILEGILADAQLSKDMTNVQGIHGLWLSRLNEYRPQAEREMNKFSYRGILNSTRSARARRNKLRVNLGRTPGNYRSSFTSNLSRYNNPNPYNL
jgi:hypothetical protein